MGRQAVPDLLRQDLCVGLGEPVGIKTDIENQLVLVAAGRGKERLVGHGAQRKRQTGRVQHFGAGGCYQLGKALTTKFGGVDHALPAALCELRKRVLEARGGGDHAILPAAGLLVTGPVQRGHHVLAELGGLFQHGLRGVLLKVGHAGQGIDLLQASQVRHGKHHVFDGGGVTHGAMLQIRG